jgi:hypothetical protein
MVLDDSGVILVVKPDNTEKYVVWQEMIGERKPQLELLQDHVGGRHIKLVKIFYKGVDRDAYIMNKDTFETCRRMQEALRSADLIL